MNHVSYFYFSAISICVFYACKTRGVEYYCIRNIFNVSLIRFYFGDSVLQAKIVDFFVVLNELFMVRSPRWNIYLKNFDSISARIDFLL